MYCDFFGFSEKPFTITPNPHFVYLSAVHREAFARLIYGVDCHAGFISLTGEVGTGKTTMLRTLLSQLDSEKYRSALIFNSSVTAEQLLTGVCREFCIDTESASPADNYLELLNNYLLQQHRDGRTVVLVIDEAQNLAPGVLEQIRLISNLETESDKLIQIVLAGQPELDELLGRHDLRQLSQRITVRCRLTPMTYDDSVDYIRHRLKVSGSRLPDMFSKAALKKIYNFSGGTPRLINVVCEQALVKAWTGDAHAITGQMAAEVIRELRSSNGADGFLNRIIKWLRRK